MQQIRIVLADLPANVATRQSLQDTVHEYIEVKGGVVTLNAYVQQIEAVFSRPSEHVNLGQTPQHLTRTGVRVEGEYSGPVNDFVLTDLSMGDRRSVAIAIAQCSRSELPRGEDLFAMAERFL
ncbi:hypothetical protein QTH91_20250 [Variovorax dokdonensis]|uniref:Uncharacterized protein n=1 Tax=Variovorax dokdonensis TaxID=344883 RepID=A0ABT7NFV7_9BURK|nr:hypothetical protein [Variovorax dokdonensis]MDM0046834.1 hypothetical protein [Variovorax dokdonensis]